MNTNTYKLIEWDECYERGTEIVPLGFRKGSNYFSLREIRDRFCGGFGGGQEHWRQGMISIEVRVRRAVYSGRVNSKDERTEKLGVI